MRAREADSVAAFGGIVALNRPIDVAAAEAIVSTFIEAVIAPSAGPAARAVLARKANMRVVTATSRHCASRVDVRSILGAMLVQERDRRRRGASALDGNAAPRRAARRDQAAADRRGMGGAALRVARLRARQVEHGDLHQRERTLAIGAGQMSRVDAVNVAVMKALAANRSLAGSVAASDAFFPFRDGLDAVASAGATAVVQPGGSVRDAEVIAAADEHGLAMVFTGRRHFRH